MEPLTLYPIAPTWTSKWCPYGQHWAETALGGDTRKWWGRRCPDCVNAYNTERRLENPDRHHAYQKAWRQAHPDKVRESKRRRRRDATDEQRQKENTYRRGWYASNREKERARIRADARRRFAATADVRAVNRLRHMLDRQVKKAKRQINRAIAQEQRHKEMEVRKSQAGERRRQYANERRAQNPDRYRQAEKEYWQRRKAADPIGYARIRKEKKRRSRGHRAGAICEHGRGCFAAAARNMPLVCAVPGCQRTDIQADHIYPLRPASGVKKGVDCRDNLQPLCKPHNVAKRNGDPVAFMRKRRTPQ